MSYQTRITDLLTALGTDYKTIKTWLFGSTAGSLASLATTDKTSVVHAINELHARPSAVTASETVAGIAEIATLAEVATGTDSSRFVTSAGVRQERVALKAEILGAATPATLDTLDELAAALGDDANFAATTATALGNRVRVDTAAQGLNSTQQSNARTNIAAVATADIGNPDTDLVALYNTAKA